jgi:hypothetical protein
MTQQYHPRRRFAILIALLALGIVIVSLFTGPAHTIPEEKTAAGYSSGISVSVISLASEAEDLGWRPLMRFFK